MSRLFLVLGVSSLITAGCTGRTTSPTAPATAAVAAAQTAAAEDQTAASSGEQPPFNLEAILSGDGFGLVKFRQERDPARNVVNLDAWVRDLIPATSYRLQRAVDTQLDDVCTGTNWLTLGEGLTPAAIVTDDRGTGRAALWRDLSAVAPGSAFDIHFRIVQDDNGHIALQSGCYRFIVRE